MFSTALHHPRKLWLRRALFQVHLWVGVLLSLYVAVIGLSGSLLVFEDEIRHAFARPAAYDEQTLALPSSVLNSAKAKYPGQKIIFLQFPNAEDHAWSIYLEDAKGKDHIAFADPSTGQLYEQHLFIDWVKDVHVYLLMGRIGFILNCVAGMGLLVLAITGLFLWWPGIKIWMRGFYISFRHRWKRINFDTHNAVGIWTLGIVSWWGITAVFFLLPFKVAAVVNVFSPLVGMKMPIAPTVPDSPSVVALEEILKSAKQISSGPIGGVGLPEKPGGNVTVYVDKGKPGDFSHRDIDTFDGHTGKLLTVWHYGEKTTLGDWFLWLMHPLHFGTLWGTPVKVLWFLLGFSLPILSISGLLMYWNRYLSKRWQKLTQA